MSSNYQAFFATLRKRTSKGLTFSVNYTLAKSLDDIGAVQNYPLEASSSFDHSIDYGPSFFDHRHGVTGNWVYELPFAPDTRIGTSNPTLNKVIGGWYFPGIFKAASGLPLTVAESNEAWGGGDTFGLVVSGAIPINRPDFGNSVHSGVPGSGGVGIDGNPATGGSGLNIFADPQAVLADVRQIQLSIDGRSARGVLRGPRSSHKELKIRRVKLELASGNLKVANPMTQSTAGRFGRSLLPRENLDVEASA